MQDIQKRQKKNGKISYTARIRIKGYPSQTKTFDRLTDAKEWLSKTETQIKENINFPMRKLKKLIVANLIDEFIENELPKKKEKIQKDFLNSLNWYKNKIGKYLVSNLSTYDLVKCRDELSKKPKETPIKSKQGRTTTQTISNATVNRYMTYMRVVFSYFVKNDVININPMAKVEKLSEDNARVRYLDEKEIKKLLIACKNENYELYVCVLIALLTGARKSEILKLTWQNVDLEHKMFYFLDTKNGENRGVPMQEALFEEFIKLKEINKIIYLNKKDFIFKTPDGKQKESLIGKLFPKIVKECKIENFRFHDLRHTHASYQAMNGISQAITQKTLGHKSPAMTNRYSHFRAESLRQSINETGNIILKGIKTNGK
ncbi:MAG: site-specific integrase [Candidatus Gastranaerophilales bacterium]|nr:site-specific integrase [Candidatus Gastranaerophilales bacterium]